MRFLCLFFVITGLVAPALAEDTLTPLEDVNKALQFAAKIAPYFFDGALTMYDQIWCMNATTEADCALRMDNVPTTDPYWDYRKQCKWCPATAEQADSLGSEGLCSVKAYGASDDVICDYSSEAMDLLVNYGAKGIDWEAAYSCMYGGVKDEGPCGACNLVLVDPRWTGVIPKIFIYHRDHATLCNLLSSTAEVNAADPEGTNTTVFPITDDTNGTTKEDGGKGSGDHAEGLTTTTALLVSLGVCLAAGWSGYL